jgi:hypothetical protein
MAYTTPHVWTSEQATVALMNEISDNIKALFPVGTYTYLCRAATTSETFIEDCWLECNAVSVLRADYPDLNTLLSGLGYPFGTVDGTHMTLPDAQGRSLVSMASGGHADVNGLGDSDALAKASRTPKESVAAGGTVSGTTGAGSSHTHGAGTYQTVLPGSIAFGPGATNAQPAATISVTGTSGAEAAHTHSFSGSVSGGGGALSGHYLVGGVLFIKAVT